ncbi:hypothetical protein NE237_018714 [Protea cynaroides]|uniref:Core domain-containing protein n=1 Tax=Protea cynaroides TaxID=273540 RepID=A0A9Q0QP66_9MAGN|nr:hypothetical protein NE237_018714 [Protea cynaroides]
MAFSAKFHIHSPALCRLPRNSSSLALPGSSCSISFRSSPVHLNRRKTISIRSSSVTAPSTSGGLSAAISLTDNALKHFNKMKSERNEDLCLRIGVKQGGCSGMSYTMEFEKRENARPDDIVIECDGFVIVCDPKSLLFLYGMQLDFSDALIGGGFSFKNPNATQTCGCGKSFAAEMPDSLNKKAGKNVGGMLYGFSMKHEVVRELRVEIYFFGRSSLVGHFTGVQGHLAEVAADCRGISTRAWPSFEPIEFPLINLNLKISFGCTLCEPRGHHNGIFFYCGSFDFSCLRQSLALATEGEL